MPETITGTGLDELTAMIDTAPAWTNAERPRSSPSSTAAAVRLFFSGAEERSRTVEGRALTTDLAGAGDEAVSERRLIGAYRGGRQPTPKSTP